MFPAPRGALFPGSLQGSLQCFPSELVFRVLSFLSAEDLTAAAPVCRHFRSAVCSNMLWRRLFVARYDGAHLPTRPLCTVKELRLLHMLCSSKCSEPTQCPAEATAALSRFGNLREETEAAKEWERPLTWKVVHTLTSLHCQLSTNCTAQGLWRQSRVFQRVWPRSAAKPLSCVAGQVYGQGCS